MLAQKTKLVVGYPINSSSTGLRGTTGSAEWVNLGKYHHVTALVNVRSTGGSVTMRLQKATSSTGAGATNTGFHYWYNKDVSATGGDALTAGGASTSAVTISTGTALSKLGVIEADSSDIQGTAADYKFVRVSIASTTGANACINYILSDARYTDASPPSALS